MTTINRQLLLAQRPKGLVDDSTIEHAERELPEVTDGGALVRVELLSIDPTIRTWMDDIASYLPPIALGEVVRSVGIGEVVASSAPDLAAGTRVFGLVGWQDYAALDAASLTPVPEGADPQKVLGLLGITGLTAYFGLLDVGRIKEGDAVLVSGAAGATGSVVGQLARAKGASKVVGVAGSAEKCAWLTDELGFDAAINYKADDVAARLDEEFPDGIDLYFDNVGGELLDHVLARIANHARVVLCGAISAYTDHSKAAPIRNHINLIPRRGTMQGLIILDYAARYAEAQAELSRLAAEGAIQTREHVVDGLERAPEALNMLFTGANTGKLMVRVR
jgi:NADPH-dependent curcumin reductase CurA